MKETGVPERTFGADADGTVEYAYEGEEMGVVSMNVGVTAEKWVGMVDVVVG